MQLHAVGSTLRRLDAEDGASIDPQAAEAVYRRHATLIRLDLLPGH